jgi:hypothetical protein
MNDYREDGKQDDAHPKLSFTGSMKGLEEEDGE